MPRWSPQLRSSKSRLLKPRAPATWHSRLSPAERRTFLACYGGWTLDALDTQMLPLVLPAILVTWKITRPEAGLILSAALAASALGGWLAGALADRYGRVRILVATLLCFSVFSLLSALARSPAELAVMKGLEGLGFGGEWAVGTVLIAETFRPERRGKALGAIQSGWAVGWGLAVVLFALLSAFLPPPLLWRVLFALGVLPALLVLYIQRSIPEPQRPKPQGSSGGGFNMLGIFAPGALRVTLVGSLLGIGAHGGYYALTTWLPTYLMDQRHISVNTTSAYLGVIIFSFWCGCLGAASLLDRWGCRRTILLFSLGCIVTIALYLLLPAGRLEMFYLGMPLGFCSAGIPASMGALFSQMYPSGIRGTGVGFCYNFGRVVAAGFPALVGLVSVKLGLGMAIGVDATAGYVIVACAVLLLPETKTRTRQRLVAGG